MIPKVKRGNGFRGVLDYALKKEKGQLIGGNMIGQTPRELSAEFKMTRQLSPTTIKPVWHTSLAIDHMDKLSDQQWRDITNDYMKELGFSDNHQFVVIKHEDTKHPHVHIIASRIGANHELYKGENDGFKSGVICGKYEREYDLRIIDRRKSHKRFLSKEETGKIKKSLEGQVGIKKTVNPTVSLTQNEIEKAKRLGEKATKKEIFDAVTNALKTNLGKRPEEFAESLKKVGVGTEFKTNSGGIYGVSFTKDTLTFMGSKLSTNKAYSWNKIKTTLNLEKGINHGVDIDGKRSEQIDKKSRETNSRNEREPSEGSNDTSRIERSDRDRKLDQLAEINRSANKDERKFSTDIQKELNRNTISSEALNQGRSRLSKQRGQSTFREKISHIGERIKECCSQVKSITENLYQFGREFKNRLTENFEKKNILKEKDLLDNKMNEKIKSKDCSVALDYIYNLYKDAENMSAQNTPRSNSLDKAKEVQKLSGEHEDISLEEREMIDKTIEYLEPLMDEKGIALLGSGEDDYFFELEQQGYEENQINWKEGR